jgi:hypothetical protein
MPISVVRLPPPALERSLVPYTVTMINRLCDALLKAFGGDFQSGTTTFAATGLTNFGYNVNFPVAFNQTDSPSVLLTPTTTPGGSQWFTDVGFATNTAFSIWGSTIGGAPATGIFTAKWVAWYP